MKNLFRLWRTIRYLKVIQITNRLYRRLVKPRLDYSPAPYVNVFLNLKFHFISRPKSILEDGSFKFLNIQAWPHFPEGWNSDVYPKLWLYNLHYFEGLLNEDTSVRQKQDLIKQWISENSGCIGNGWEPYPTSLRICNWIKWHLLTGQLPKTAIQSLAVQTRYLEKNLEYHLLGNHLFANAKALVMAGIFYTGPEATRWYRLGYKILEKQMAEQFLRDGAHFELSTTYHALLLEDLLDIIQLMQLAKKPVPRSWLKKATSAVDWLSTMTRPDGVPPLFNDAAYSIAPCLKDIVTLAEFIKIRPPHGIIMGLKDFPESGYFRYEGEDYSFFGDAGHIGPNYIPGHAHCDMGNFELFASGNPIIVDTGISTYEVGNRRNYERSTAAHNTVQIGDQEQSEIWESFRVGSRAKIKKRLIKSDSIFVRYQTYKKNIHERTFSFKNKKITISDKVLSNELSIAFLHLDPKVVVSYKNNILKVNEVRMKFFGAKKVEVKDYFYAPEFNKLVAAKVIHIFFRNKLKTEITI